MEYDWGILAGRCYCKRCAPATEDAEMRMVYAALWAAGLRHEDPEHEGYSEEEVAVGMAHAEENELGWWDSAHYDGGLEDECVAIAFWLDEQRRRQFYSRE